jgi:hypothetical protein
MSFPTTLRGGWRLFLKARKHLKHPENDYITLDYLQRRLAWPELPPRERAKIYALKICLFGDVLSNEVPDGQVSYGCKYVRYDECKHFGESVGAQACVEMKNASARFPTGRTTLMVGKAKGRCEFCEKRERRREWIERGRYWRGLV